MKPPAAFYANDATLIERAARAVAKAHGFEFKAESIVDAARTNPRAYQFLSVAKAVLAEVADFQNGPSPRQE